MWFADMQYKISCKQHKQTWETVSSLLDKMFGQLKELELKRRVDIRAALESTLIRTNALWKHLPAATEHVQTCLSLLSLQSMRAHR